MRNGAFRLTLFMNEPSKQTEASAECAARYSALFESLLMCTTSGRNEPIGAGCMQDCERIRAHLFLYQPCLLAVKPDGLLEPHPNSRDHAPSAHVITPLPRKLRCPAEALLPRYTDVWGKLALDLIAQAQAELDVVHAAPDAPCAS